ncbi:hypothetical protein OPV22_008067 [Ensete ventricosum]|uniref:Uncharacterized protein n=1 Tax=Ensete ventricosum TaxID=4639 RepID=A0AAV8PNF5_ENSVE|nr:hypothetical protein OPV22_008067 [Ensete ventricosum]
MSELQYLRHLVLLLLLANGQLENRSYDPGKGVSHAAVDCGDSAMEASLFTAVCSGADQLWVNGLTEPAYHAPNLFLSEPLVSPPQTKRECYGPAMLCPHEVVVQL